MKTILQQIISRIKLYIDSQKYKNKRSFFTEKNSGYPWRGILPQLKKQLKI